MTHLKRLVLWSALLAVLPGCATTSGAAKSSGSGAVEVRFEWDRDRFERIVMTAEIDGSTLVKDGNPPGLAALDAPSGARELTIQANLFVPGAAEPTTVEQAFPFEVKKGCTNLLSVSLSEAPEPTFALQVAHECQAEIVDAMTNLEPPPKCPTPAGFDSRQALQNWASACNAAMTKATDSLAAVTEEVRAGGDLILVNCLNDKYTQATILLRTSSETTARKGEEAEDIAHDAQVLELAYERLQKTLTDARQCL